MAVVWGRRAWACFCICMSLRGRGPGRATASRATLCKPDTTTKGSHPPPAPRLQVGCSWLEAIVCACLVALQWTNGKAVKDAMMTCEVLVLVLSIMSMQLTVVLPAVLAAWAVATRKLSRRGKDGAHWSVAEDGIGVQRVPPAGVAAATGSAAQRASGSSKPSQQVRQAQQALPSPAGGDAEEGVVLSGRTVEQPQACGNEPGWVSISTTMSHTAASRHAAIE